MKKRLAIMSALLLCLQMGVPLVSHAETGDPLGDITGDGIVDSSDAARILEVAAARGAGTDASLEETDAVCDVNGDGAVDSSDGAVVLTYAAGSGAGTVKQNFPEYIAARKAAPALYGVQYSRVNDNYANEKAYTIISSYAGLMTFAENVPENRFLSGDRPFEEAAAKYDEAFFEEHDILLIHKVEGSGDNRNRITDITADADNNWTVHITHLLPETGTADMAAWYLFAETSKGVELAKSISFEMTELNEWDYQEQEALFGVTTYSYTSLHTEEQQEPVLITCRAEAERYLEAEKAAFGEAPGDLLRGYDDAFFAERALILIRLNEPSWQIQHQIREVTLTYANEGLVWCIHIDRLVPETYVSDSSSSAVYIVTQASRQALFADDITVELTDTEYQELPSDD